MSGRATYDALVELAASANGATLLTRDARAAGTYEALGVAFDLIPSA
ncbi:MAG: hypothetical protein LBJ02_04325 [Bifidobacteriaceae bacterium]|nr:hypothetical protein [Bifidobacteriaceae bacterium]